MIGLTRFDIFNEIIQMGRWGIFTRDPGTHSIILFNGSKEHEAQNLACDYYLSVPFYKMFIELAKTFYKQRQRK